MKRLSLCFLLLFPFFTQSQAIGEKTYLEGSRESHFSTLQRQLRETENQANSIEYRLKKTKQALVAEKLKLLHLNQEEKELSDKLHQQKSQLAKQVALTYRVNDTSLMYAMLSHQNINEADKVSHYLRYLNESQTTLAEEIKATLLSLSYIKHDVQIQTAKLEKAYSAQLYEQKRLSRTLQEHHALLAAVS